jgi:hypothetical protein
MASYPQDTDHARIVFRSGLSCNLFLNAPATIFDVLSAAQPGPNVPIDFLEKRKH